MRLRMVSEQKKTKNKKNNKTKNPKNLNNKEAGNTSGDETENGHNQSRQKARNKESHSYNGNNTTKKHLKITSINKGNSKLKNVGDELLVNLSVSKCDICILSEANHDAADPVSDNCTNKSFKEFNIEAKTTKGTSNARIMLLVKKEVIYERMGALENDVNSAIVIRVSLSKRKFIYIIGVYRQWKSVGSSNPFSSESNHDQLVRMNHLMNLIQKVINEGFPVLIGGDFNIDRHLPNDPINRPDLKDLYPLLDDLITNNALTQLNTKPTRIGHKSSLLVLLITNCPNKVNEVTQYPNSLSEHEAVEVKFHFNDIQIQPQFYMKCNYSNVIWANLEPLLTNSEGLNELFSIRNPDTIANILIEEISKIIEYLAPESRSQARKSSGDYSSVAT